MSEQKGERRLFGPHPYYAEELKSPMNCFHKSSLKPCKVSDSKYRKASLIRAEPVPKIHSAAGPTPEMISLTGW